MIKKPNRIVTYLFNEYKVINEKIPYINSGGCGVFAEKLYNLLVRLNLNPSLIVLTNNANGMNERINGAENTGAYITHIVIKLNGYYIDSSGVYKTIRDIAIRHDYEPYNARTSNKLTIDVLVKWNNDKYIWNNKFNRKHIKVIQTSLNKTYIKAKKDLVVSN